ncbi:MAG: DUF350 domain-containing protein [Myxococcota bacterium]
MDPGLALVGVAKLFFGLLVGVAGITIAARMATRFAGFDSVDEGLRSGNVALGVVVAGAIGAIAILVQHAVAGTFGALDLIRYAAPGPVGLLWIAVYAVSHVGAALGVGVLMLMVGTRAFVRLTPQVDEIAEIHDGNVASAVVLAAMLVALALLAQQGVETMLDGLLPIPGLGRDGVAAPS